jgi:hypothetical protein
MQLQMAVVLKVLLSRLMKGSGFCILFTPNIVEKVQCELQLSQYADLIEE